MLPRAAAALLLLLALALGPASGRQLHQAAPGAEASRPVLTTTQTPPSPTRVGVWAAFFPLLFQEPPGSNNYVGEHGPVQGAVNTAAARVRAAQASGGLGVQAVPASPSVSKQCSSALCIC